MSRVRRLAAWVGAGAGLATAAYATYAGVAWYRYGTVARPNAAEADPLLDRFMPVYEVAERHHIRVEAPADITLAAAREADIEASPLVRAIFRMRALVMGASGTRARTPGLLEDMRALGWGVLAEVPHREVVMGAVTQPWEADVTFQAVPPDQFAVFAEPGYVKIVWTLRADPLSDTRSIFRTETRVMTTDADARARFRRYWAMASPGIIVIRWALLRPLKEDAERRARSRE